MVAIEYWIACQVENCMPFCFNALVWRGLEEMKEKHRH